MIRGRRRDRAILLPAIGAQLITTTGMFIVPVLLDALQRGGLRATTAGLLFSLELTASAVTTLLLPTFCRPHSFRRGALLGGLLAILGNALTLITPAYLPLLIARLITGFGAGIVAAEATMVLARGFDRERLIAAMTIAAIVNAAFWLVILPAGYVTYELAKYFKKWLGGYTGDCVGAIQQVTEIVIYLGWIIVWRYIV